MTRKILVGDVMGKLAELEDESVHAVTTSPPYWRLRNYKIPPTKWPEYEFIPVAGLPPITIPAMECCYGLEPTIWSYIGHSVMIFEEVRRVLRTDGTLWLNSSDSYISTPGNGRGGGSHVQGTNPHQKGAESYGKSSPGLKRKDLASVSGLLAGALQANGWWWRDTVVWHKTNPSPSSARGRTTPSHEYLFILAKCDTPYFDDYAISEPTKTVTTKDAPNSLNRESGTHGIFHRTGKQRPKKMPPIGGKRAVGRNNNPTYSGNTPEFTTKARKRSVWSIPTQPFDYEMCMSCKTIYSRKVFRTLSWYPEQVDETDVRLCRCGAIKWLAHFATFAEDIPRLAFLAGTSQKGCCAKCGSPWERTKEEFTSLEGGSGKTGKPIDEIRNSGKYNNTNSSGNKNLKGGPVIHSRSVGWQPTCECDCDELVPATTMDIFGGSGRSAKVAQELGRDWIYIDLNPDYALFAEHLTSNAQIPMNL